jgi:serine protease inhibitor
MGLVSLLIATVVGWMVAVNQNQPPTQKQELQSLQGLGTAESTFGIQVFQTLAMPSSAGGSASLTNVLISPLSISVGMAMCSRGASQVGLVEIYSALRIIALGTETDVSPLYQAILSYVTQIDSTVTVALANSAWCAANMTPAFVYALKSTYDADALPLASVDLINTWVSQKTNGLIPRALTAVPPNTAFLLLNAIYFKGPWATPFDSRATVQKFFSTPTGLKPVYMMQRSFDSVEYTATDQYQMVELPYGQGSAFSAFVVLPADGVPITTVIKALRTSTFTNLGQMGGDLTLPRIQVGLTTDLTAALQANGIQTVFQPGNLNRLTSNPAVALTGVLHTAFLTVTEQGIAPTAAGAGVTGLPSLAPRFTMNVNRPFIYAVRAAATGDLLLLGYITDPQPTP